MNDIVKLPYCNNYLVLNMARKCTRGVCSGTIKVPVAKSLTEAETMCKKLEHDFVYISKELYKKLSGVSFNSSIKHRNNY